MATIPELHGLHRDEGGNLHLGPMLPLRVLRDSPLIQSYFPALAKAFAALSPVALERGTLGGLLHANDVDSPVQPALMTIHTNLRLQRRGCEREVPLGLWIQKDPEIGRCPDEVLVEAVIPALPKSSFQGLFCLRLGNELSRPGLVLAASFFLDQASRLCTMAKIVLAGIAPQVVWAEATEAALTQQIFSEESLQAAAEGILQACPDDFVHALNYRHRVAVLQDAFLGIGRKVLNGEDRMIGIPIDPSWPTAWEDPQ